jgi:hypothetical protein
MPKTDKPAAFYKFLDANGKCVHGTGSWHLPSGKRPGKWMPRVERLTPCRSGYHVIESDAELHEWIAPELYEVEVRGERVEKSRHVGIYHEARLIKRVSTWNERTARLFACDCAERVTHLDKSGTAAQTIAVARRYANGLASADELRLARAVGDAAWAAGDAVGDAAWAAWVAAWAAAGDAAWAARAAAGDAARAAERAWQAERLRWYLDGGDNGK